MTSMREKIAERLMRHYAEGGPYDGFMEADIVLDAFMEPTEGVLDAACDVGPDTPNGAFSRDDAAGVFTAMIFAAKEGK
jgi:hypothetical protein